MGEPELAGLGEVLPLLQLLPPDVASQQRSAVGIHAIGEVLAVQADPRPFPALKLQLTDKAPLLHAAPLDNACTSAVEMMGSSCCSLPFASKARSPQLQC